MLSIQYLQMKYIKNGLELTTKEIIKNEKPYGLKENKKVAKRGGKVAGNTRQNIEKELGMKIITKDKLIK